MDGLFSLSCHPVRRGARAGNLGEKRTTPGALVVHDRNGSVQLATITEKLPNLTVLGALNHPSLHLAPRDLSVSSLLRQRESCLSLFILDLYELYRSTSQRQITSKVCAGYINLVRGLRRKLPFC
jgi:hypothetical protein